MKTSLLIHLIVCPVIDDELLLTLYTAFVMQSNVIHHVVHAWRIPNREDGFIARQQAGHSISAAVLS